MVGLLVVEVVEVEVEVVDDGLALRSRPVSLQAGVRHCNSTLSASTRCQLMEITAKPGPISLRVARLVLSVLLFTLHSGLAPAASEQRTLGVMVSQREDLMVRSLQ